MPRISNALGRHGVSNASRVVLYSTPMGDAVLVWMLQSLGFENAAVLDGGLDKWSWKDVRSKPTGQRISAGRIHGKTQGRIFRRQASDAHCHFPNGAPSSSTRSARSSTGGWSPAGTAGPAVSPAVATCSAATLLDPKTKAFIPLAEAEAKFKAQGITKDKRVVAYCGGISATVDLFLLHRLGYDNLTLYDGSMGEWAKDTSLPIETVRRNLLVIPGWSKGFRPPVCNCTPGISRSPGGQLRCRRIPNHSKRLGGTFGSGTTFGSGLLTR